MTSLSRIGLGTVQFGAKYGISNRCGQPGEKEVADILVRAVQAGFGYLDTATTYGDAEVLIGRHLPSGHGLRIVTKLPPVAGDTVEARHANALLDALAISLDRLRVGRVHSVMIHHAIDLRKPGWQRIVEVLCEAKARGWTECVGASVYDAAELVMVERCFALGLVQLPLNALDRRLIASGCLERLKASGVEVHARSLFLQGLLLMEPATLPSHFAPLQEAIAGLRARWAEDGLTPLAGCLRSVLRIANIDAAIVGVNSLGELMEIEAAVADCAGNDIDYGLITAVDPIYLDPRRWPPSVQ
jgi:aryl-alcohol dehydrogenase-like predicted oxidoreductase